MAPPGYWQLEAVQAGLYDIILLIAPTKDMPETATIRYADREITRRVSPGADVALFRNVPIEAGELKLSTQLTTNGEQRPAHQVIVQRR